MNLPRNQGPRDPAAYRPNAGVMLLNERDQVFVAQRLDHASDAWQMPQGGLDPGEAPLAGALRELHEETGIAPALVTVVARLPHELYYDVPRELAQSYWRGHWLGQRQWWFLARYLGSDSDVDLATAHPEFRAWRWAEVDELVDLVVPFKRALYGDVITGFAAELGSAVSMGSSPETM